MFSPSLNGRFILFVGAVLVTSLLQVAPVSVSASAGMMALMWGMLGLFHLSATGWNLPDMLRGISSLPARLIRSVGAKEDERAGIIRTHVDGRGFRIWAGLCGVMLLCSFVGTIQETIPPELQSIRAGIAAQADALGQDMSLHVAPGAEKMLQHFSFFLCLGIITLLARSFSTQADFFKRGCKIFASVFALLAIFHLLPQGMSSRFFFSPTMFGYGPGMADLVAGFNAAGMADASSLARRVYDAGWVGAGLVYVLCFISVFTVARFAWGFRQHGRYVAACLSVAGMMLFLDGFTPAGPWRDAAVFPGWALIALGFGYASHREKNPYDQ